MSPWPRPISKSTIVVSVCLVNIHELEAEVFESRSSQVQGMTKNHGLAECGVANHISLVLKP